MSIAISSDEAVSCECNNLTGEVRKQTAAQRFSRKDLNLSYDRQKDDKMLKNKFEAANQNPIYTIKSY